MKEYIAPLMEIQVISYEEVILGSFSVKDVHDLGNGTLIDEIF